MWKTLTSANRMKLKGRTGGDVRQARMCVRRVLEGPKISEERSCEHGILKVIFPDKHANRLPARSRAAQMT